MIDESEVSSSLVTLGDAGIRAERAGVTEPTDAELERAIVSAVSGGAFDVARILAGQLEDRRRARAGNVVPFEAARRGRA